MLLELLLSLVFSEEASQLTYVADATQAITERVLVARRIISQDRPSRRPMIANNFSNREIRFFGLAIKLNIFISIATAIWLI